MIDKFKKVFFTLILCMLCCTRAFSETVHANGIEIFYEVFGDGEPLILLHSFGQAGALWAPMTEELGKHYQLIIPDLRGHGSSTNPSGEFIHSQSAVDVFSLMDHLQFDQVKAMGISSGGMTLLHMATQQPDRMKSVVLIGATSYFPPQAREIANVLDPIQNSRELHLLGDEQAIALQRQFKGMKDNYTDMNFTAPLLSTITAKTLIIHGDRDPLFPIGIAVEMYESIPESYLWIIPNGGHIPVLGATQQQFLCTSIAFLNDKMNSDWPLSCGQD